MAILVIKLKHIGDTLIMTPAIRHLKETFPDEPICALVRQGCEVALQNNPDLASVFAFGKIGGGSSGFAKLREFHSWSRHWKFRLVFDFSTSDRGAICGWLSGAKERVAYAPFGGGFWGKKLFYTKVIPDDFKPQHEAEKDLELVRTVTGRTGDRPPLVYSVPQADMEWAETFWNSHENGKRGLRIVCHATSRWMFKCCDDATLSLSLDQILSRRPGMVLLSAGQNEQELQHATHIQSLMKQSAKLLHPPQPWHRLAALMKTAGLFVGIDSGPMHLAAAVGVPVLALFGPTPPKRWRPWSETSTVIEGDCPCRAAKCLSCSKKEIMKCLASLQPDTVVQAAEQLLKPPK